MVRPFDEHLLDVATVLTRRSPMGAPELSAFEAAVIDQIDGARSNGAVARALGITDGDLRIALTPLLANGWLEAVTLRPPLLVQPLAGGALPRTPTGAFAVGALPRTATPRAMSTGAFATSAEARVDERHDDRHGAAGLHALAIRELRLGHFKNARSLAEQALAAAPGVAQHRDTLAGWDAVVGKNLGASLTKPGERVDAAKAFVAAHPDSGHGHGRLAEVLADVDIVAALAAASTAVRLAPTDQALREQHKKIEDEARQASRRQKWKAFFTLTPSTAKKTR